MSLRIRISLADQTLRLLDDDQLLREYPVSTSKYGPGERQDSHQTPRGRHEIAEKIGGDQPIGAVFTGRKPTGEILDEALAAAQPERDWILSRILWLTGCEEGFNCGGDVDTHDRYIYIHGTADAAPMGTPHSIGCVRMRNDDVIDLYDRVAVGTPVLIQE